MKFARWKRVTAQEKQLEADRQQSLRMASESRFTLSPRKQGADNDRRPRTRVEDENALEKFYHMGEILGQGSFGVVREATHRTTGKKFAIKAVSKDKVSEGRLFADIEAKFFPRR